MLYVIGDGTRFTQYTGSRSYGPAETAGLFRTEKSARKVIKDTNKWSLESNRHWIAKPDTDPEWVKQLQDEIAFWESCQVYEAQLTLGSMITPATKKRARVDV